ncbi:hypothetical protein DL93DRAFT_2082593 [Clavulina sp. PMI_390]|nr:hypothetical protein DL93DRAFT_2082593 [Clavulina sp. PMI_390]
MVRFKNRWLLIEFIPVDSLSGATASTASAELTSKSVYNALKNSVIHNFGAAGWGAVGSSLNVKYFSPITNMCIVRVARDHHRIAWAATTLITSLSGRAHIPTIVKVSGTIKKVQIAAIQHDQEIIARTKSARSDLLANYLKSSRQEIEAMQD